jgi:uncharacterized protein (UPF0332 family)
MREENIKYRIQRANETFQDAIFLFEKGSFNSSINRLYYSACYAVIALLIANNIEVKSHNGVKNQFGNEFINKGLLEKHHAKTFSMLSDFRHKGDYDDLFDFDRELVERLIEPTRDFINSIENLLKASKS